MKMCIPDANPNTYIYLFVTWNYYRQGDQAFNCLYLVLCHIIIIWINIPAEISILSFGVGCVCVCFVLHYFNKLVMFRYNLRRLKNRVLLSQTVSVL